MEDNLFKASIRMYFRCILWLVKIVFAPVWLIMISMMLICWLVPLAVYWVKNDAGNFIATQDSLNEVVDDMIIKWYKI